jgi:hypothetical protein
VKSVNRDYKKPRIVSLWGGALFFILQTMPPLALGGDYLFFATYRPILASPKDCPAFELIMEEFETEDAAKARKKTFFLEDGYRDKNADVIKPGRVGLVYQYQGRSPGLFGNCVYKKYSSISGLSEEDARNSLRAHAKEYSKYFVSDPEVIKVWTGNGYFTKVTRNYDGVEVTYTSQQSSSGRTLVMAKIRNTHTDKLARLFFRVNGQMLKTPVDVNPLGEATLSLGKDVEHFGAALQLHEPQDKESTSDEIMNSIKAMVREEITIKGGKMKAGRNSADLRG